MNPVKALAQNKKEAARLSKVGMARNIRPGALAAVGVGAVAIGAHFMGGTGQERIDASRPQESGANSMGWIGTGIQSTIGSWAFDGNMPEGQVYEGVGAMSALLNMYNEPAALVGGAVGAATKSFQYLNPNSIHHMAVDAVQGQEFFSLGGDDALSKARKQADKARKHLKKTKATTKTGLPIPGQTREEYVQTIRDMEHEMDRRRDNEVRRRGQEAVDEQRRADRKRNRNRRPVPYRQDYRLEQNTTLSGARGADTLSQGGDRKQRERLEKTRAEAEQEARQNTRSNRVAGPVLQQTAEAEYRAKYGEGTSERVKTRRKAQSALDEARQAERDAERQRRKNRNSWGGRSKRLANSTLRRLPHATGTALGMVTGAAAGAVVQESINTAADRIAQVGTPGSTARSQDALRSRRVTRRGSSTGEGVNRYAGETRNLMTGETVLALHKTGGSGAVLT